MSIVRVNGVWCERSIAGVYLKVRWPDTVQCIWTGPKDWRTGSYNSTGAQVRTAAQAEGWMRIRVETSLGVQFFDVCPVCFPVLEPALKAVQS